MDKLDVRYVRYIGPGLRGGQVFLVPGTVRLLRPAPRPALRPRSHGVLSAVACVVDIGGPAPFSTVCTPLAYLEHPAGFAIAPLPLTRLPVSTLHRLCARAYKRTAERARCVTQGRKLRFGTNEPQVITGVVSDGIATVDVYGAAATQEQGPEQGPGRERRLGLPVRPRRGRSAHAGVQGRQRPCDPRVAGDRSRCLRVSDYSASRTATVIRVTAHSRPSSSVMRTSQTQVVRPR